MALNETQNTMKPLKDKTSRITPLLKIAEPAIADWTDYVAATPVPLNDYIKTCEIHCVAGCCGVDAFEFSPEQGAWWTREAGDEKATDARELLDQLIDDCSRVTGRIALYNVEVTLTQPDCIAWLREMREALNYIELRPGDLLKISD